MNGGSDLEYPHSLGADSLQLESSLGDLFKGRSAYQLKSLARDDLLPETCPRQSYSSSSSHSAPSSKSFSGSDSDSASSRSSHCSSADHSSHLTPPIGSPDESVFEHATPYPGSGALAPNVYPHNRANTTKATSQSGSEYGSTDALASNDNISLMSDLQTVPAIASPATLVSPVSSPLSRDGNLQYRPEQCSFDGNTSNPASPVTASSTCIYKPRQRDRLQRLVSEISSAVSKMMMIHGSSKQGQSTLGDASHDMGGRFSKRLTLARGQLDAGNSGEVTESKASGGLFSGAISSVIRPGRKPGVRFA
jgi:hypothetical protein